MIVGKTAKGWEFAIPKKRFHNMRLIEVLANVDEDPTLLPTMLNMLLGKEQKEAMYKFLEDEDGIVLDTDVTDTIKEIFAASAADPDIKN